MKPFFITTTLPYVNGSPHIGFALELITADVIARSKALQGFDVIFNTGTDEHGINIYRTAENLGKEPQAFVDEVSREFKDLQTLLNVSTTHFIRTTDAHHIASAQEFWRRCLKAGDIYKKAYEIKYCTGCELEKTESELTDDGKCLLHPSKEIEVHNEENYFFRWSKYQEALLQLYEERPDFVLPKKRLNEIKSFVEGGLQDFSISRLRSKLPWGIPVPGDEEHVMYVWFDALVNYISTLGWPEDEANFQKYWPGIQIAGKDNVRQQSAMWQAMLASAGIPFSERILINGFINVDGQKMSKSLGNVIAPDEMVQKFGTDGTRYLLLSLSSLGEDSDINWGRAQEKFNADLANGLGNLVSRTMKLAERMPEKYNSKSAPDVSPAYQAALENFEMKEALDAVWSQVQDANEYMSKHEPWKLDPALGAFSEVLTNMLEKISVITYGLKPFLPETAEKMEKALQTGQVEPLFQRL